MGFSDNFILTLFTNDRHLARRADLAGIDRIGVDLEGLGKQKRQGGKGCWISDHTIEDIHAVRGALSKAELFARTNAIYSDSRTEIDACVEAGVTVLMLPMFHSPSEVEQFVELVDDRAKVSLLLETPAAAIRIHDIVRIPGVHEIHIGLNDMRLGMGLASHFEILASDFLDTLSKTVLNAGLPFGFGGVGRFGDNSLPISSDLIYAQYPRLGAKRALVSRVFIGANPDALDLNREVALVRQRLDYWAKAKPSKLTDARDKLRSVVAQRFTTSRNRILQNVPRKSAASGRV